MHNENRHSNRDSSHFCIANRLKKKKLERSQNWRNEGTGSGD